jgi:hypothetical protein
VGPADEPPHVLARPLHVRQHPGQPLQEGENALPSIAGLEQFAKTAALELQALLKQRLKRPQHSALRHPDGHWRLSGNLPGERDRCISEQFAWDHAVHKPNALRLVCGDDATGKH